MLQVSGDDVDQPQLNSTSLVLLFCIACVFCTPTIHNLYILLINLTDIKSAWREKLLNPGFRNRFLITVIVLIVVLLSLARFLDYNEELSGFAFNDPLLSLFNPVDVTWFTFVLIYVSLIVALISLSYYPEDFLIALQSYSLVFFFRFCTIFLLPLDAPATTISLTDPFVEFFGGGETLHRDLFFSGHVATMFIFYLTSRTKKLKKIFLVNTILVAAAVLIQHVHYTVDVVAAPFFAYSSYKMALFISTYKK